MHTGIRQLADSGKHIGEPGLPVDVVELGSDDEGVHRRGALAAAVGASELELVGTVRITVTGDRYRIDTLPRTSSAGERTTVLKATCTVASGCLQ